MTDRFVFRPLLRPLGARVALLVVFAGSGLIHELVISLPAHGGYGGPTAYFLIQALAILFARSLLGRGMRMTGRMFSAVVVLGPVCLLFHRPFVDEVVLPFMHALGALP